MTTADALNGGRGAFDRRAWADAYSGLSAADHEAPLSPEDLERLALAAYLSGRDGDSAGIWARAYHERLHRDDGPRAALRESLAAGGDRDLARRFFRAAAKPVNTAWRLAAGADLSLPQVKGPRPLPVQVINAYLNRALAAAERDPVVAERFLRAASLQDPPQRMFRPSTALRATLGNLRRRRAVTDLGGLRRWSGCQALADFAIPRSGCGWPTAVRPSGSLPPAFLILVSRGRCPAGRACPR